MKTNTNMKTITKKTMVNTMQKKRKIIRKIKKKKT